MEQAMRDEFEAWWNLPAQSELRKSCARGWAELIWKASRAALRVELPAGKPWFVAVTEEEELHKQRGYGWNDCLEAVGEILWKAGIEVAK